MIWSALLTATLVLVYRSSRAPQREAVVEVVAAENLRADDRIADPFYSVPKARISPVFLQSNRFQTKSIDVFRPKSWAPPPPPVMEVAPIEEVERAPELPFHYVGQLSDSNGKWLVQLMSGDRYLVAGKGDIIDDRYRLVDLVDGQLHFTYLPMSLEQTLDIAAQ